MKTLENKLITKKKKVTTTGANQSFFVQKAEEAAAFLNKINLPQQLVESKS